MFAKSEPHLDLARTCASLGIEIELGSKVISDDIIIYHNPSFLKFEKTPLPRLMCDHAIIVNHDNLLTPQGLENYDVAQCLALLEQALLCRRKTMVAVSPYNLDTINRWMADNDVDFDVSPVFWPNIIDLPLLAPTEAPKDRRGRHSRVGPEKFPPQREMEQLFPPHALYNGILGGNIFMGDDAPMHWNVHGFRSIGVDQFLGMIDFFVYFTHPGLRESFGRVIAEAISAGKLVITDPVTARNFGAGVVGCTVDQVDAIIQKFVAEPETYVKQVRKAQTDLQAFSPARFLANAQSIMDNGKAAA